MQDEAPPHITRCVTDVLKHHFTEERVISRQFRYLWPPQSPDLNPSDFCLWGPLKQLQKEVILNPVAAHPVISTSDEDVTKFEQPAISTSDDDVTKFEHPAISTSDEDVTKFEQPAISTSDEDVTKFEQPAISTSDDDVTKFEHPATSDEDVTKFEQPAISTSDE
ncbi:uncharacterized protein TNCV_692671 [Trichonephila clavipes]|nr:uncharacterized protein TNCV_692671 [Trichonephila clavipes]